MMGLDYVWLRKVLTVLMSRFLSLLASEVWYVRPDEYWREGRSCVIEVWEGMFAVSGVKRTLRTSQENIIQLAVMQKDSPKLWQKYA